MDGVRLVACADAEPALATQTAERFHMEPMAGIEELAGHPDVDVVHIATPPWAHVEPARVALRAGKHVLCEKPLATRLEDAVELQHLARQGGLVLSANLIMRYNPLAQAVSQVIEEKLLGEPIYAEFVNCAKDEQLGPDHWFWDLEKSGGIFIEHGVHFFDLFASWFGAGRVLSAQRRERPDAPGLFEQVACQCVFGQTLVHFYHGFTQAARMDRQEFRIVLERGDIRMTEWVPTTLEVCGLMDTRALERVREIVPHARLETLASYADAERQVYSRHKRYETDGHYRVAGDLGMPKMEIYALMVRALLADQIAAIRNPAHSRRIDDENGVRSLELAAEADRLSQG